MVPSAASTSNRLPASSRIRCSTPPVMPGNGVPIGCNVIGSSSTIVPSVELATATPPATSTTPYPDVGPLDDFAGVERPPVDHVFGLEVKSGRVETFGRDDHVAERPVDRTIERWRHQRACAQIKSLHVREVLLVDSGDDHATVTDPDIVELEARIDSWSDRFAGNHVVTAERAVLDEDRHDDVGLICGEEADDPRESVDEVTADGIDHLSERDWRFRRAPSRGRVPWGRRGSRSPGHTPNTRRRDRSCRCSRLIGPPPSSRHSTSTADPWEQEATCKNVRPSAPKAEVHTSPC